MEKGQNPGFLKRFGSVMLWFILTTVIGVAVRALMGGDGYSVHAGAGGARVFFVMLLGWVHTELLIRLVSRSPYFWSERNWVKEYFEESSSLNENLGQDRETPVMDVPLLDAKLESIPGPPKVPEDLKATVNTTRFILPEEAVRSSSPPPSDCPCTRPETPESKEKCSEVCKSDCETRVNNNKFDIG